MTVKRTQVARRRLNDAYYGFGDPFGQFSWSKFIAVWAQIAALFHFGVNFELLAGKPESLAIILAFVISPELFKKLIAMKYGGTSDHGRATQNGDAPRKVKGESVR